MAFYERRKAMIDKRLAAVAAAAPAELATMVREASEKHRGARRRRGSLVQV